MRAQFARSWADFERAVGGPGDARREEARAALLADFGFIVGYWAVFAALSGLLAARGFSAAVWLGAIAGEVATITAVLDVVENVETLRVLRLQSGADPWRGRRMRGASLAKWFCAFLTGAFLSVIFLQHGGWQVVIGVALLLAGALGMVAVVANVAGANQGADPALLDRALALSFAVLGVAVLVGLPVAAAMA
jgi:hypothetical protein